MVGLLAGNVPVLGDELGKWGKRMKSFPQTV